MDQRVQLFSSIRYDSALAQVPRSKLNHAGWNFVTTSSFYMLDYHRDRILRAAKYWGWDAAVNALDGDEGLARVAEFLAASVPLSQPSSLRVKLTVSEAGIMGCETSSTPEIALTSLFPETLSRPGKSRTESRAAAPALQPEYEVVVDSVRTSPSEYTHYKTTKRDMYDSSRRRAQMDMSGCREVLLVNIEGLVMEGSLTTPYFWRDDRWVTPSIAAQYSPGLGSGGQDGTTRRWALER